MSSNKGQQNEGKEFSAEIVKQFLEVQTGELSVRKEEIALKKEQLRLKEAEQKQGYEYSLKALSAQKEDRTETRKSTEHIIKCFMIFVLLCRFTDCRLPCRLYFNKDQIVIEVLKFVGYVSAGGFGGFGISESKRKKSNIDQDES